MATRTFRSAYGGGFFVGSTHYLFGPDGLFETGDLTVIQELEYLSKHAGHITEVTPAGAKEAPKEVVKAASASSVAR